jgi:hypothetical protein
MIIILPVYNGETSQRKTQDKLGELTQTEEFNKDRNYRYLGYSKDLFESE